MKEIIDGKINDIEYDNASCKILWILKEANISAEDKEKEIDVCEGFRNDWRDRKFNRMSPSIARFWSYRSCLAR